MCRWVSFVLYLYSSVDVGDLVSLKMLEETLMTTKNNE